MKLTGKNKVIIILGPTSSGKSSLAVKLAKEFNGEIISVDSRQVFREMNLGTGKVEGVWKDGVYIYKNIPHYLIDFVEPEEEYNVSHFKRDCEEKIIEISEKGKTPILCGGTGFWIQAIVDDVEFPEIKPDLKLRKELKEKSLEELQKMIFELDSERAATVDKKNKVRLIRAIEIAKKVGKVPKIETFKKESAREIEGKEFEFLQIGIPVDKNKLLEKIKTRLEERFKDGMVEEISNLYQKHNLTPEKIQNLGIAYSLVPLFKKGELTREELFEKIVLAEKKYAKRQMTWFQKDPRIKWENNYEKIRELVANFKKLD